MNCKCGKEYNEKRFDTLMVYNCTDCGFAIKQGINCEHTDTKLLRLKIVSGAIQVKRYCNTCKNIFGSALKQAGLDLKSIPLKEYADYYAFQEERFNNEKLEIDQYIESLCLTTYGDKYKEYLESEEWKRLRLVILERDNYECQICFSPASDVHHLNYHNFTNEYLFELVSLCRDCHEKYHQNIKNKGSG